ncbi:MTH1187 family thiamine-binding protein [Chloroflexota bacterium]
MAIIEVSVVPLGTETPSVSRYVAGAVKVLQGEKGIKYELTSMGTIIEGDLTHLLNLAEKMHQTAFAAGAKRVVTTIKIDERRDQPASMESKVESVRRELGY